MKKITYFITLFNKDTGRNGHLSVSIEVDRHDIPRAIMDKLEQTCGKELFLNWAEFVEKHQIIGVSNIAEFEIKKPESDEPEDLQYEVVK